MCFDMKKTLVYMLTALLFVTSCSKSVVIDMRDYGIVPDTKENMSPKFAEALQSIRAAADDDTKITLLFEKGRYDFHPEGATVREYYIYNHDQTNPKKVGLALEDWDNLTLDGQGADFIFHGRMLPLSLIDSENCILRNFSIDFEVPHITQIRILKSDGEGIVFEAAPWTNTKVSESGYFQSFGEGWSNMPQTGIAFEEKTKHVVYKTSDLWCPTSDLKEVAPRTYYAPHWRDSRLIPGTAVAMRTYYRPAPGIFLSENENTKLQNVKVHYAEGMGLLAQLCENITLEAFSV